MLITGTSGFIGGILQKYLRLFAQEGIGRPDLEIESDINRISKFLRKKLPDLELPPINSALVFYHHEVVLETGEAPVPTIFNKKLKDFIRKRAKEKSLIPETMDAVIGVLDK